MPNTSKDKYYRAKEIIFNPLSENIYTSKKIERVIGRNLNDGVVIPILGPEQISTKGVMLHPEFFVYTYFLEGCSRRLLLYLIFHCVNLINCEYVFNKKVVHDFTDYCKLLQGEDAAYKDSVVGKAHRELVDRNVVQKIDRNRYMLNPIFLGANTIETRRILIKKYSATLVDNGKDSDRFYPSLEK